MIIRMIFVNLSTVYNWWGIPLLIILIIISFVAVEWYRKRIVEKESTLAEERERLEREHRHRQEAEEARKEKSLADLRNQELELELKHRSSELADSTTNLIRKNDMLQEMDQQLELLAAAINGSEAKTQLLKRIDVMRREIRNNMSEDDNWDKFEQNFNLVYDNFMVRISERYPTLKTADKRICAYLRMGLSSKEMASLMNTAVRSIETARYRLRKKLELDSSTNLVEFLQKFDGND